MRLICSSLVSSLLFLTTSALPADGVFIPPIDPNLVYPRNHTLESCPRATWAFPYFSIDTGIGPPFATAEEPPSLNYWNASLLEREPISGGASDDLSYFQGTLAPDVLACQIYGYSTFSDFEPGIISTTAITLEPDIQYAFSYTLNHGVEDLRMQPPGYDTLMPKDNSGAAVEFVWSQYIGSKGVMGGVEFMLKQQLSVIFIISTNASIADRLAGSLAVFKEGP